MEDEKKMLLYREGDQAAFTALYQKYSPMVYGFLKKRLPPAEVDDAFQNVWRHLHEKKHAYDNQPFAPWFFHMIRNLLIDQYRSAGRRNGLMNEYAEELATTSKSERPDIEEIMKDLTPESKDLVQRFYLEGQSYSDIEKDLGVSQSSLRKRLSRIISQLRKSPRYK